MADAWRIPAHEKSGLGNKRLERAGQVRRMFMTERDSRIGTHKWGRAWGCCGTCPTKCRVRVTREGEARSRSPRVERWPRRSPRYPPPSSRLPVVYLLVRCSGACSRRRFWSPDEYLVPMLGLFNLILTGVHTWTKYRGGETGNFTEGEIDTYTVAET